MSRVIENPLILFVQEPISLLTCKTDDRYGSLCDTWPYRPRPSWSGRRASRGSSEPRLKLRRQVCHLLRSGNGAREIEALAGLLLPCVQVVEQILRRRLDIQRQQRARQETIDDRGVDACIAGQQIG